MGKRVIEIKAKNGTVYLYEDESYWDKEKRVTQRISASVLARRGQLVRLFITLTTGTGKRCIN